MQIDLMSTPGGEVGLVSNHSFDTPVSAVIFDVGERRLTLEFGQAMDSLRMNIPVSDDFVDLLKKSPFVHFSIIERQRMVHASQVALVKVSVEDDDDIFNMGTIMQKGVVSVQAWIAGAKFAQAVHRDDLANESSTRGILFDVSRNDLKVAPQLAQELAQQKALVQSAALRNAPNMAPPSLGPGSNLNLNRMPKPPTGMSDE